MEHCIHDGKPARYLLAMAEQGRTYTGPDDVDYEPICGDCRDSYQSTHVTDTCECDEGHVCEYHAHFCPICERERDTDGPLCRVCKATAKAYARMARHAELYPDPEGR